ncbi:alkyl/aryl-sulfatase [Uliginosibacterium sp. sgz301328]|uniref:alkyl/aryl-sulfatase n=1 Tax=Uliginosibacterium sp. sgz301328 TaxID=3243764 RepID=UPI00359D7124
MSHPKLRHIAVLSSLAMSMMCGQALAQKATDPKDATSFTRKANAAVLNELPFADRQDFEDAQRGFIGTVPDLLLQSDKGVPIYDLKSFSFITGDAPATVNPSAWRQEQLNNFSGLFKVIDRVYQVRGFDMSNMTIIEGDTGLILIDPLISQETAKVALELYFKHRPRRNVVAVIYTHSHVDHYGGVKGVVSEADVKAGKVKILAPEGFLEESVSENVYAGNAMGRRALYQYGVTLPKNAKGLIGGGLGKATSAGVVTLIPPTDVVKMTGETRTVDGIRMEFLMAPNTEAPAEFLIYFPQFRMLDTAEDATHTLHNLYTLRGAQARDARTWWKTLDAAITRYASKTDVVIAQHHWPMWDQKRITPFLENQRDGYKYLHDQVLNLANKGYTMVEIAEMIQLPDSTGKQWYNRGYYGSVNHNAKAVYQRYLGWYDSNPANLHRLPPVEAGKRYVALMGGADKMIAAARKSFDDGDYRWVAEIMNHVVFADPDNAEARNLEADALEQMGYQAEDPTWRNEYLAGAQELRHGVLKLSIGGVASADTVQAMTPDMLLDYMGIRLNGPKAAVQPLTITWKLPEAKEAYALEVRNGALIYSKERKLAKADATLEISRSALASAIMGGPSIAELIKAGTAKVQGDQSKVEALFALLDTFDFNFPIVTP